MYFELIASVIFVIALIFLLRKLVTIRCKKAIILLTVVYICIIIYFTIIRGSRQGLGGVNIQFPLPFLKSIITMHYGLVANRSMLNIILFIPFGFLAPLSFYYIIPENSFTAIKSEVFIRCFYIVLLGFVFSLTIELCQLIFRIGVFELDDLIKNTLGAFIGYYLFKKYIAIRIISD